MLHHIIAGHNLAPSYKKSLCSTLTLRRNSAPATEKTKGWNPCLEPLYNSQWVEIKKCFSKDSRGGSLSSLELCPRLLG